jgi:hypothetical protein
MHLSEASHVMEALSTNDANAKLQEGWKLLAVVVTTHPNGQLHPCYVLGKSDEHNGVTDRDTTGGK